MRFKVGKIVQAYNKSARVGGVRVAFIRILELKKESIALMPDSDYEKEGFKYMEERGLPIWDKDPKEAFQEWRQAGGDYWVVDFELLSKENEAR
jgi:hypothetical protein